MLSNSALSMGASLCDVVLSSFLDHEQEKHFCEWHHVFDIALDVSSGVDKPHSTGEASHAAIYGQLRKTSNAVVLDRSIVQCSRTLSGFRAFTGLWFHDIWLPLLCVRFSDLRVAAPGTPEKISSNTIVSKFHLGRINSHKAGNAECRKWASDGAISGRIIGVSANGRKRTLILAIF